MSSRFTLWREEDISANSQFLAVSKIPYLSLGISVLSSRSPRFETLSWKFFSSVSWMRTSESIKWRNCSLMDDFNEILFDWRRSSTSFVNCELPASRVSSFRFGVGEESLLYSLVVGVDRMRELGGVWGVWGVWGAFGLLFRYWVSPGFEEVGWYSMPSILRCVGSSSSQIKNPQSLILEALHLTTEWPIC